MRSLRSLALAAVVALAAAFAAAPASAHSPDQHEAQLLPESALSTFNVKARMAASMSATCEDGMAGPYPCKNIDLAGFVPLPMLGGATGNDVWGWTDPETKREYAIVGTSNSTGFIDVTDPADPVLVGILPTRGTPDFVLWRDVKVHNNYAFIVSEITDSGLQVFDLTRLRGRTSPTVFDPEADATYDEFSTAHNISINSESQTAYAVGTDIFGGPDKCTNGEESGGLHMIDISDPLAPTFAGCALVNDANTEDDVPSNNYAHDVECVIYDGPDADYQGREICFGSNEDAVVIYDVTDKANPTVISQTTYPTASYTHQGSLSENKRWFIFGDELDEQNEGLPTTTYILDAGDLDNPPTPKAFAHETQSIDHNLYTHGGRVYASNYTAGLRILDYDDELLAAGQLDEVAYFDVVPGVDAAEFAGTWSNYRFPGSGNVAVSTIENEVSGLFMLTPTLPAKDTGTGGGDTAGGGQQQQQPPAPPSTGSEQQQSAPCASTAAFRSAKARPRGRRVRMAFSRRANTPVRVDVFQNSRGRRVLGERLVARFKGRRAAFTWNGRANRKNRKVRNGYYFVRFTTRDAAGRKDVRRTALRRKRGRWVSRPAFYARNSCGLVKSYKLERPVFGGRTNRSVSVAFRLSRQARVSIAVLRRGKVVKRYPALTRRAERKYRVRLDAEGLRRGTYRVRVTAVRGGTRVTRTLATRRL